MKKFPNQSSLKRWNFHCSSVQTTTTELKYFILLSMVKWLPSERCVAAFWESWSMRLIRLLYYDCRWVVKCSVLSSIGLCHSEKYYIRACTDSLSLLLYFSLQLSILHIVKGYFPESGSPDRAFTSSFSGSSFLPRVSHRFWVLSPSLSLCISPLIHCLECVISLTLSHSFSLSLLCERPERLTAAH